MHQGVEQTRKEELETDLFTYNALMIISEAVNLISEHTAVYMDEILHSIFFLGKLINPNFSPESILKDNMLDELKDRYTRPFELYSSQLPKRSPISCVLDMIVLQRGPEDENGIIEALRELTNRLKKDKFKRTQIKPLVSSAICVSQNTNIPNSVRYYGVSMSTYGRVLGQIMVAASCLSSWDSYVADAVMTYYPDKKKKSYFDGTIKLPGHVRCQAFSLSSREPMRPCRSCGNLFGLTNTDNNEWPYGHCAEAESVSNLLENEAEVKEQVRLTSDTYTEENRQRVKGDVLTHLAKILKCLPKLVEFYNPQEV